LVYIARSYNLDEVADYWEQVVLMNNHQKQRFADNIVQTLFNTVSGKRIAMLGWAFKKDTNDTRESAAIYVADYLLNEHPKIAVYCHKVHSEKVIVDLVYINRYSSVEIKLMTYVYDNL